MHRHVPLLSLLLASLAPAATPAAETPLPGGALEIVRPDGRPVATCPLERTEVRADVAGFLARTRVRQVFRNPLDEKVEAIYAFPLPHGAAVDEMVLVVGDRRIVGRVEDRDEARRIYEAARSAGHVAGLLDQERPNVFTQSVANIEPGARVEVEIAYVERLAYDDGLFEWVFPMVVGPRYVPGGGSAPAPLSRGRSTPQVPDGDRITPPVTPAGTRAGHDVDLEVRIDGGTAISDLASELHEIDVDRPSPSRAVVRLAERDRVPNRDFVLRYRLSGDAIEDAFLVHEDERGTFFTLMLEAPRRVEPRALAARELIFVLDTSGSMAGFPIEKAKDVMARLIDGMRGDDTFNLITFAGETRVLWERPRANTTANRAEAEAFLRAREGSGGTEMMQAIRAALAPSGRYEGRMRIVCFLTDGYVGNDLAIVDAVEQFADTTRVFGFGIGNSVNRFLLEDMAHAGRGEAQIVTLAADADAAVRRFEERLHAPVLTDVTIDWGRLPVREVYPRRIPDLFAAGPILVHGRLDGPAAGTLTLRGRTGAGTFERAIRVAAPEYAPDHEAIPSLWARAKLDDLLHRQLGALQEQRVQDERRREIVDLGKRFRLSTPFTSFVAVEERVVTVGGVPTTIHVPVEMPAGVSHDGVFGDGRQAMAKLASVGCAAAMPASPPPMRREQALRPAIGGAAASDEDRPASKLAYPLRELAERVAREGRAGNLTADGVEVVAHRVAVLVLLKDATAQTLEALARVGFSPADRKPVDAGGVYAMRGTIDVRNLDDLAALDAVVSVR